MIKFAETNIPNISAVAPYEFLLTGDGHSRSVDIDLTKWIHLQERIAKREVKCFRLAYVTSHPYDIKFRSNILTMSWLDSLGNGVVYPYEVIPIF